MVLIHIAISPSNKISISDKFNFINNLYFPFYTKVNYLINIPLIDIKEEFELTRQYCALLEHVRTFKLKINCPDNVSFQVPPLIIQPIIENSIQWAFIDPKSEENEITIDVRVYEKYFQVLVLDNGIGLPESHREGFGIKSVRDRIKLAEKLKIGFACKFSINNLEKNTFNYDSGTVATFYFY